jgi:hypothetical protein
MDDSNRKYVWDSFQQSACQRIETFRLYVSLSTAILGGWVWLLKEEDCRHSSHSLVLGILLVCFSIAFFMLDCRMRNLVDGAVDALIFLEEKNSDELDKKGKLKIFDNSRKSRKGFCTYHAVFMAIFTLFGLIGLYIMFYSLNQSILIFLSFTLFLAIVFLRIYSYIMIFVFWQGK